MEGLQSQMNDTDREVLETIRTTFEAPPHDVHEELREEETLEIRYYPEDQGDMEIDEEEIESLELVQAAQAERQRRMAPFPQQTMPIGYVTNARNAAARSDMFQFWSPAEEMSLGIGSIVRHTATTPYRVDTYAIIIDTEAHTLGLDDYAIHVYEQDAQPPLTSIIPAPSARRPVIHYQAKVLASTHRVQRPVLSGPVYAVVAKELADVHSKEQVSWLDPRYLLMGFYEDANSEFGIFGEEQSRVLGPKQGHVILSGLPGAGKTSLFLTLVISLYAQLRNMEEEDTNGGI